MVSRLAEIFKELYSKTLLKANYNSSVPPGRQLIFKELYSKTLLKANYNIV